MRHRKRVQPNATYQLGQMFSALDWDRNTWYPGTVYWSTQWKDSAPNARVEHCYDVLHNGPPYLEGGPFNKWMYNTTGAIPQGWGTYTSRLYGAWLYKYVGGFLPSNLSSWDGWFTACNFPSSTSYRDPGNPTQFSPDGAHSWGDVSSYGANAWRRFRPGKATASAGVFIGELSDLPRMLKTTAKGFKDAYCMRFGRNPRGSAKKAADHWLNTQFGWLPFISDLRSFYKTYRNADKIIQQLIRDNGQWIKRGGTVTEGEDQEILAQVTSTNNEAALGHNPALGDYFYPNTSNKGTYLLRRITAQKVWFEARFRYYIPNIESVQWRKRAVQQLFGLELTPSLVWELIPWSWLIDWCTNVGDVLSNVSNSGLVNNLAAKYAYLMGTTERTVRQDTRLNLYTPVRISFEWCLTRKQRIEANPFGFSVTWDGLTPRQWSILGALGITRMH